MDVTQQSDAEKGLNEIGTKSLDRRRFLAVTTALPLFVLAGCGGSDGGSNSSGVTVVPGAGSTPTPTPTPVATPTPTTVANTYKRPVHFVYALSGGKALGDTDQALQQALAQVTGGVTALVPFFLNVLNPASNPAFASMLSWVTANNITLVPGVGQGASGNTLNNTQNQAVARGYLPLGTHIRLENLTGFYQNPNGAQDVSDFIDYCISIGFTRIMLNPWPFASGGTIATFTAKQMLYIDATFQQVDPNTYQLNTAPLNQIIAGDPSINVLVNYESPGPQQVLAAMETSASGSSTAAFQTTLTQLAALPSTDNLHWCPPFTQSYDPLSFVPPTWPFIAGKLSAVQ